MNETFEIILYYNVDATVKHKSFNILLGTSIAQFLRENNISDLTMVNEISVGVYGKIQDHSYIIKPNDRLELYNDIIADPKIRRKNLAKI
jgi:putative ubiquitin-RnfH superfamily antitoxin RatB of RatAB toxin-antitoxin module